MVVVGAGVEAEVVVVVGVEVVVVVGVVVVDVVGVGVKQEQSIYETIH